MIPTQLILAAAFYVYCLFETDSVLPFFIFSAVVFLIETCIFLAMGVDE